MRAPCIAPRASRSYPILQSMKSAALLRPVSEKEFRSVTPLCSSTVRRNYRFPSPRSSPEGLRYSGSSLKKG